ncbi:phosphatidylinositol glycan, class O [Rhodotorula toruloides]|uniref:Phosphatidylinositol glycan, class O n=1 Tax=Rhodotorula toruloides TaxID=5286 RepID=A0A511K6U6_RHOTO|nr:phosphatidylinositol glycan, class O [Rhodotorula toruloides]
MASQAAATWPAAPNNPSIPSTDQPSESALYRARRWLHVLPFLPAGSTYLSALTLLALLHGIGLLLFTRGFLLTRKALPNVNTCNPTAPSGNLDPSCSLPPTHDKLIFLVVDALRADFVLPVEGPANPFYSNRIPLPAHLTRTQPTNSFLSHFIADAPTTTLQRLKGMTTGSLPTFIDAGSNFAGEQADEDNWLGQAKRAGKRIALVGDETWLNVFPRGGKDSVWQEGLVWPFDSFDVEDLDTVDRGVREHLVELLDEQRQREWDIVIAHGLGLDHAGHRFGAEHRETTRKLRETEHLLRDVVERLQEDTLLVVVGDHGMTDRGDHGGDSRDEVDAALWVYSKTPLIDSSWFKHDLASPRHPLASLYATANGSSDVGDRVQLTWPEKGLLQVARSVSQIDLVPTISLLLGLPIPFGNLGLPIPELFFRNVNLPVAPKPSTDAATDKPKRGFFGFASSQPERRDQETLSPLQTVLQATLLASSELSNYLLTYTSLPSGKDLVSAMPELSFILEIAKSAYKGAHAPGHSREEMELRALDKFWTFERKAREKARLVWARFDPVLMGAGLVAWCGSLIVAWRLANAAKKGPGARFLVGRAVEGGLIALASGLGISAQGVFKGRPSGLAAAFVAAVGAELAVFLAPSTSPLSLTTRLRGPLARRAPASLIPLVTHAALFASNSLTVFEDRIVLYLLATLLSFGLIRGFAAPEARLKNRIVAYSAIALASLRLMSWSTICREEQVPKCHPTFHLTPGSTPSIAVLVLSVIASVVVPSILRASLTTSKSDEGVAPAFLGAGIRALLLAASAYWVADSLLAASSFETTGTAVASLAKTGFARVVLVGGLLSATLVWYLSPLCIRVQREQVRNAGGMPIRTQIKVIGFANALGSSYLLFFATIFVLLFLVLPPPAQLVLTLHLVVLLCLLEIFDSERDAQHLTTALTSAASLEAFLNSDEGGLPPPPPHTGPTFVQISMLALLAHLSFFSTGHQAVISSIQWSTAFIGFPSLTYPFSPILVTLNTLAGFVLTAAALPLFVFWNLSPTLKDQGAPMIVGRNLLRAGAGYMAYFAVLALASATCSTWLRRHLMVWKIFAPRFMLAGVALLATDFVIAVLAMAWVKISSKSAGL